MPLVEDAIIPGPTRELNELKGQLTNQNEELAQEHVSLDAPLRLEHGRLVSHNAELLIKR